MYTFTDLQSQFLDNIGQTGSTDTNLLNFFKRNLNDRYQLFLAEFTNYQTIVQKTAATVASQQYYHKPVGIVTIDSATVDVGSLVVPLEVVDSQRRWDYLNQLENFTGPYPTAIFPRRDDFGLYPIPGTDNWTITLNSPMRDRKLINDDYTTGTVTFTNNSQVLLGSGTTFTSGMVGRWVCATATTGVDRDLFYRISAFTDATHLTLETSWEGATIGGTTYKIGEVPEIPEETHPLLAAGATADYFAGPRGNITKAIWWNNVYQTGDGSNAQRDPAHIRGGLIGAKNRYATRSDSAIIRHDTTEPDNDDILWANTITS